MTWDGVVRHWPSGRVGRRQRLVRALALTQVGTLGDDTVDLGVGRGGIPTLAWLFSLWTPGASSPSIP